ALVDEVGGFDEDQLWCEDLDLFLRLAAASPVARLSEPLCFIRSHFVDDEHYSGDRVAESAYRAELFDKLSRRIADPRLRAICRRRRAEQSLALARFKAERGDHRGAFRTLASASAFSWSYPDWWWGALKTVGRPVVPEPALRLYRQLRP
ncbi:MAG TPA: hypothetical protein VE987_00135, partial [Polyangiaceae bacterium]|nr:hypothetical protein [Polyangiaceae bacterium]